MKETLSGFRLQFSEASQAASRPPAPLQSITSPQKLRDQPSVTPKPNVHHPNLLQSSSSARGKTLNGQGVLRPDAQGTPGLRLQHDRIPPLSKMATKYQVAKSTKKDPARKPLRPVEPVKGTLLVADSLGPHQSPLTAVCSNALRRLNLQGPTSNESSLVTKASSLPEEQPHSVISPVRSKLDKLDINFQSKYTDRCAVVDSPAASYMKAFRKLRSLEPAVLPSTKAVSNSCLNLPMSVVPEIDSTQHSFAPAACTAAHTASQKPNGLSRFGMNLQLLLVKPSLSHLERGSRWSRNWSSQPRLRRGFLPWPLLLLRSLQCMKMHSHPFRLPATSACTQTGLAPRHLSSGPLLRSRFPPTTGHPGCRGGNLLLKSGPEDRCLGAGRIDGSLAAGHQS